MNIKNVCLFLILLVASLTGCNTISNSENTRNDSGNNSYSGESVKTDKELVAVSEEEQLKNSDLVCRVVVTKRGEVEFIDNQLYMVIILKF